MRVVGCQSRKVTHKTSAVTRQRDAVSSLLHLYFRSRVLFGCPSSTSLFSPTLDSVMSLQFSAFLFVCFKTRHFFGSHGPLKKNSCKPNFRRTENVAFDFEQTGGIDVFERHGLVLGILLPVLRS